MQIYTIRIAFPLYILRGHMLKFPNNYVLHSLKIVFILANSAGPDEMLHFAVFHLGLHCLPRYLKYTTG